MGGNRALKKFGEHLYQPRRPAVSSACWKYHTNLLTHSAAGVVSCATPQFHLTILAPVPPGHILWRAGPALLILTAIIPSPGLLMWTAQGTHAYLVTYEGARKLLALCPKATFHVDLDVRQCVTLCTVRSETGQCFHTAFFAVHWEPCCAPLRLCCYGLREFPPLNFYQLCLFPH
jgi:hypothetical protein